MAGTRDCNSTVTAGRLSKAVEFFDAAERLEGDMPNAAGDLFVDAGIAACLKNKAAYTHQTLSTVECKKMNRAASRLIEAAKRAVASAGR